MITTGVVVAGGFIFFIFLLLCFWELYITTTLGDLEADAISAKDLCDQINPFLLPEYVIHAVITLFLLFIRKWIFALFNICLVAFNFRQLYKKKHLFDCMELRRNDVLNQQKKMHYLKLGFFVVCFIWSLISFIVDLVNRIIN
ncbi:putative protein cornichon [Monocercomonoides exilis]|uniref:putative protein cornichon n=1 Tax=Monocercomonoides exilis TaxID=2049356 RepID=UPI003559C01F|nr:putative protein cornichon [Monocercomonoides exilis]